MTPLVWRRNAFSPRLLCYATDILAFHHCTGSQQSASRGRVLAFYRIAPCLNTERSYIMRLRCSTCQPQIPTDDQCSNLIGLFTQACRTPAKFEFSPNGKEVLRHSTASSLESSISFSTLLFRRNLTLPFFKFCCFPFLCTEYGTVWGITQCCSICILFAPS